MDQGAGGLRAHPQLVGHLCVGGPVDLPAHERVTLLGRQGGDPVEHLPQARSALHDHMRAPAVHQQLIAARLIQGEGVAAQAAELVQAAVAGEREQPRRQVHLACVAAQGAVRAHQRLLDDVLGILALPASRRRENASSRGR